MLNFLTVSATADASTMTGLLTMAGDVVSWLITQMGAILTFITTNPILLLGAIIMIAGLAVGMLSRVSNSL